MLRNVHRLRWLAVIGFLVAIPAAGQTPYPEIWNTSYQRNYKLAPGSTLVVDNRVGNVVIEGVGGNTLDLTAKLTIRGVDEKAIRQARESIRIHSNAVPGGRMIRTSGNGPGNRSWAAIVDYYLRLPRNCNVAIETVSSDFVQVIDLTGSLQIKNFSGRIDIAATGSRMAIDTTNGDIIVRLKGSPHEDSRLTTLNGSVQLFARRDLDFRWIAESVSGKVSVSRDLEIEVERPDAERALWSGQLNEGGKRIYAASMTGELVLGPLEDAPSEVNPRLVRARSRQAESIADSEELIELVSRFLLQRPGARNFALKKMRVPDELTFETRMGNVIALEVKDATVTTGAGEIIVGRATGSLEATSHGGPINIGETMGPADLETTAGDILINFARKGGHAKTGGGNIRVRHSAGPLNLDSGGGDVTVHEARGNVTASTVSGDVNVAVPEGVRSVELDLTTKGGNVILTLPSGLRATIDATVISSNSGSHTIDSNVEGLAIVRDVVSSKNRVRARGTLNGGGPLIRILAEEGNIQLRQSPAR